MIINNNNGKLDQIMTDMVNDRYDNNVFRSNSALGFNPNTTWKGRVTDNADPMRLGRVKVLIEGIMDGSTSKWCDPKVANHFGGYGSWLIPPIGSSVYIEFEGGDINLPLYSPGGLTSPGEYGLLAHQTISRSTDGYSEVFYGSMGDAGVAGESLAPEDAYVDNIEGDHHVYVDIIHRSAKGATIKIDERDEKEGLDIIDRGGNILRMQSPFSINANAENHSARSGATDASRFIDAGSLAERKHDQAQYKLGDWYMMMKMIHGSTLKLNEGSKDHYVELVSNYQGYRDAEHDEESGVIRTAEIAEHANAKIILTSYPTESINLILADGTNLVIHDGSVSISSGSSSLVVSDGKISINGDLHVSGSVHASNVITSSVNLNDHKHEGVTAGGDQSKAPVASGSDPEPGEANQVISLKEPEDIRTKEVVPAWQAQEDQDVSDALSDLSAMTPLLWLYDGSGQPKAPNGASESSGSSNGGSSDDTY